jgi:hypothetical protein
VLAPRRSIQQQYSAGTRGFSAEQAPAVALAHANKKKMYSSF